MDNLSSKDTSINMQVKLSIFTDLGEKKEIVDNQGFLSSFLKVLLGILSNTLVLRFYI